LIDLAFSRVTLNQQLTQKLFDVTLQNIPDDCTLHIVLQNLKTLKMFYYGPTNNDRWVHEMLSAATRLGHFDTYKFRIGPSLSFASNHLKYASR
jgi:hypothetical protein